MNCQNASRQIYECLDRELTPDERAALDGHLAECPTCRHEQALLARDVRLLRCIYEPPVRVDVVKLYRHTAARHERVQRRWRRLAVVACAASVLLAAWLAVGMRIEVAQGSVSIRWTQAAAPLENGNRQTTTDPLTAPAAELEQLEKTLAQHRRRLDELGELIGLVAAEIDHSQARERRAILAAVEMQLEADRRQQSSRLKSLGRSVHMLHLAQLNSSEPIAGEKP